METNRKIGLGDLAAMMGGRVANETGARARLPPRAVGGPDLPSQPPRGAFSDRASDSLHADMASRLHAKQRESLIAKLRAAVRNLLAENARLKSEVERLRGTVEQATTSAQKVWRAASRKEEPVVTEPEEEVRTPAREEVIEGEVVEIEEPESDPFGPDDDGGLLG